MSLRLKKLNKIIITKAQLKELIDWAQKCYPNEAPAILVGKINTSNNLGIVENVYTLKNVVESPVKFQIDPEEQYRIYRIAEENNQEIIGIFHSHPMSPIPSAIDLPFLKLHQNIWVILSTTQDIDNLKAYQWAEDELNKVEIEIIE